jgi:hypothetical protein
LLVINIIEKKLFKIEFNPYISLLIKVLFILINCILHI